MRGLFVTGTDTSVGKTIIAASLGLALRKRGLPTGMVKPFATGVHADADWREDDAQLLRASTGNQQSLESISPLRFRHPLAPISAAQMESRSVDLDAARSAVKAVLKQYPFTVVEGVGGAAVPLTEAVLASDFAASLDLPVLVVSRTDLGTINHTLLTLEHLRSRGCRIYGLIFVRHCAGEASLAEKTGPAVAARLAEVPFFGVVPCVEKLLLAQTVEEAVAALPWNSDAIGAILNSLGFRGA